jgi:hypothetical protein
MALLTYVVVACLKDHKGLDVYDYSPRFNPLWVGEVREQRRIAYDRQSRAMAKRRSVCSGLYL